MWAGCKRGRLSRPHNASSPHPPPARQPCLGGGRAGLASAGGCSHPHNASPARLIAPQPRLPCACCVCRGRMGRARPFTRPHQPQPAPAQTAASPRPPRAVGFLTVSGIISPRCRPPPRSVVGVFHVEHCYRNSCIYNRLTCNLFTVFTRTSCAYVKRHFCSVVRYHHRNFASSQMSCLC